LNVIGESPSWSPDGTKIVYREETVGGPAGLGIVNANGTGATPLTTMTDTQTPSWQGIPASGGMPGGTTCVKPTKSNVTKPHCRRTISLRVSYTLTASAPVTFRLENQSVGRKVLGKCVPPAKKYRKHQKCTLFIPVPGDLVLASASGANNFTFNGKIGGATLGPGSYVLIATVAGGNSRRVNVQITS
jgi:hypothetical protein